MKFEGKLTATNLKFAVVVSRFNDFITSKLLEGAVSGLERHGANTEDIDVIWVPGAFEIPLALQNLSSTNKYDGLIALGAVIRGSTTHYDYVCNEVAKGVSKVQLDTNTPVAFGIITTENIEQAIERSGVKHGNKGYESALAAIEMVNLLKQIHNK